MTTVGTIKATRQEVTREGSLVRVTLHIDAPAGISPLAGRFEFAEPVEVAAGEHMAISLVWPQVSGPELRGAPVAVPAPMLAVCASWPAGSPVLTAAALPATIQLPGPDPDEIATAFAEWAEAEGLLPRVTEDQCRDLASAFAAGYLRGRQGSLLGLL